MMSGYSVDSALKFAAKIDDIRESMPKASVNEMVDALGLSRSALSSTQATISVGIIMEARQDGDTNITGQEQLFKLGITLGRAYERKLAANADTNSAGEDV